MSESRRGRDKSRASEGEGDGSREEDRDDGGRRADPHGERRNPGERVIWMVARDRDGEGDAAWKQETARRG